MQVAMFGAKLERSNAADGSGDLQVQVVSMVNQVGFPGFSTGVVAASGWLTSDFGIFTSASPVLGGSPLAGGWPLVNGAHTLADPSVSASCPPPLPWLPAPPPPCFAPRVSTWNTIVGQNHSGLPRGPNGTHFGAAIAFIGDLDGDGVSEAAVGAPFNDSGGSQYTDTREGSVHIMFMRQDGTVRTALQLHELEGLWGAPPSLTSRNGFYSHCTGAAVAAAGDMNGDGVVDMWVGAPCAHSSLGAAFLLLLTPNGTVSGHVEVSSSVNASLVTVQNGRFGQCVAPWYTDSSGTHRVLIGAPGDSAGTYFHISLEIGLALSTITKINQNSAPYNGDISLGAQLGHAIAVIGPLRSSYPVPSFVVAAPGNENVNTPGRGTLWLHRFGADGVLMAKEALHTLHPVLFGKLPHAARLGAAIAPLGDMNGDGTPDFLVTDDGQRDDASVPASVPRQGYAVIITLGAFGVPSEATVVHPAGQAGFAPAAPTGRGFGASAAAAMVHDGRLLLAIGRDGRADNSSGAVWTMHMRSVNDPQGVLQQPPSLQTACPPSLRAVGLARTQIPYACMPAAGAAVATVQSHAVIASGRGGLMDPSGRCWGTGLSALASNTNGSELLDVAVHRRCGDAVLDAADVSVFTIALTSSGRLQQDAPLAALEMQNATQVVSLAPTQPLDSAFVLQGLPFASVSGASNTRTGAVLLPAAGTSEGTSVLLLPPILDTSDAQVGAALVATGNLDCSFTTTFLAGAPGAGAAFWASVPFAQSTTSTVYFTVFGQDLRHVALTDGSGFGASVAFLGELAQPDVWVIAVGAPRHADGNGALVLIHSTLPLLQDPPVAVHMVLSVHPVLQPHMPPGPSMFGGALALLSPAVQLQGLRAPAIVLAVGAPGTNAYTGSVALLSLSDGNVTAGAVLSAASPGLDLVAGGRFGAALLGLRSGVSGNATLLVGAPGSVHASEGAVHVLELELAALVQTAAVSNRHCVPGLSSLANVPGSQACTPLHTRCSTSPTASASQTATSTGSPSGTATGTATPSVSGSTTATTSVSASATREVAVTIVAHLTPAAAVTSSPSPSTEPFASPASTATPSATANPTPSVTGTPTQIPRGFITALQDCTQRWWAQCVPLPARPDLALVRPLPGVWCEECTGGEDLFSAPDRVLQACPRYGACEAGGFRGGEIRCAEGHLGATCASCESGWAPQDGSPCAPCQQCSASQVGLEALFGVGAAVVLLVLLGVSILGAMKRGSLEQDLLIGALRIAAAYFAAMGYVSTLTADVSSGATLGLSSRAVTVGQWQGACQRGADIHTAQTGALRGVIETSQVPVEAINTSWVSDAELYSAYFAQHESGAGAGAALSNVFATAGIASGAVPVSSLSGSLCMLGHASFQTQAWVLLAGLLALLLMAAAGLLLLGIGYFAAYPARASPRKAAHRGALTANPMLSLGSSALKPSAGTGPPSKATAGAALAGNAHTVPSRQPRKTAVAAWVGIRFIASVYLFLWGAAVSMAFQLLAPPFTPQQLPYSVPGSLQPAAPADLEVFAIVSLVLHGLLFPVTLLVLLRLEAESLLDQDHHASVTYALLTAGYRLQLTPGQAAHVTHAIMKKQDTGIDDAAAVAVALSVEMSRRMEARCCGLAKYIPSHGFALVRTVQSAVLLAGLWISTDPFVRIPVFVFALVTVLVALQVLKPYSLGELNALDTTATTAVLMHLILTLSFPGIEAWSATLFVIHAFVWLFLAFTAARGVSARARSVGAWARGVLELALPELKKFRSRTYDGLDAITSGIDASQLPSLGQVFRALGVRVGVLRPGTDAEGASSAASSGPQAWRALAIRTAHSVRDAIQRSGTSDAPLPSLQATLQRQAKATLGQPHSASSNAGTAACPCMSRRTTGYSNMHSRALDRALQRAVRSPVVSAGHLGWSAAAAVGANAAGNEPTFTVQRPADLHTFNSNKIGFDCAPTSLARSDSHAAALRKADSQAAIMSATFKPTRSTGSLSGRRRSRK